MMKLLGKFKERTGVLFNWKIKIRLGGLKKRENDELKRLNGLKKK